MKEWIDKDGVKNVNFDNVIEILEFFGVIKKIDDSEEPETSEVGTSKAKGE